MCKIEPTLKIIFLFIKQERNRKGKTIHDPGDSDLFPRYLILVRLSLYQEEFSGISADSFITPTPLLFLIPSPLPRQTLRPVCWNLEQPMGDRNRAGIGLSYWPARLHWLAESIPWNRFLGFLRLKRYHLWFSLEETLRG